MPTKKNPQQVNVSVPEQIPVPPPIVEKVVPEPVVDEPDKFALVLDKLQSFINDAKELTTLVKSLQKENAKLQKQTSKKSKKNAVTGEVAKRNPSGFAKPTLLSDDLCTFLGVNKGSSMARTMVTKHINEYIKKNNLQDAQDKRQIIPDTKLKSILSVKEGDKLTYFNLQTFIKQHFMKEVV
jgi:upstream activation factor subunit UAF30